MLSTKLTATGNWTFARQMIADSDLIHLYWMDEDSGSTLEDGVGSADATKGSGVTLGTTGLIAGDARTAATFDGTANASALIGNIADLNFERTDPWTMMWLLNPNTSGTSEFTLYSRLLDNSPLTGILILIKERKTSVLIINEAGGVNLIRVDANPNISNEPCLLTVSYDGSSSASGVRIYRNGHPIDNRLTSQANETSDSLSLSIQNSQPAYLGYRNGIGNPYNGIMQAAAIFNTEKTRAEIVRYSKLAFAHTIDYSPPPAPVPVIHDMDMDSDVDDVLDLVTSIHLDRTGEIDLRGVIITSSHNYSPGCAYAVLNYLNYTHVPVAHYDATVDSSTYAQSVVNEWGVEGFKEKADFDDGVDKYRELLAVADDNSVVIITGGSATTLAALLQSSGDGHSVLDGSALVALKCRVLILTMGVFPDSITGVSDVNKDKTAADYVAQNWPTDVIWNGVENGWTIRTGQGYGLTPAASPVHLAMNLHLPNDENAYQSQQNGKRCFVPMSLLIAGRGIDGAGIYAVETNGTTTVNTSSGRTTWSLTPDSGHHYVGKQHSDATLQALFNAMLAAELES